MSARVAAGLDPTTFEIVWHRLLAIAEEMGITYMRCSGSQVLITGNDASTAIMLPDGSLVAMGPYITTQGNVLPLIVGNTLALCRDNPGIEPGDIFLCNDPYLGAIHHPDVATLAPVFHEGELFGWVGASGHQPDIGGMDPGGFSIRAVDTYQEGLRIPIVKLVERGRLREDLLRWVLNQVRDPLVGLDLRAQIAANEAGRERLLDLCRRYGAGVVREAMTASIAFTRERLAERLRRLPDGQWTEVQFIDHDGHADRIYRVVLTLTKQGDRLRLDFAGTSPQARGLINCTQGGLRAGVLTALYILLCHDLPWNRGVLDCVDIDAPAGTVVNCTPPTPCAMATISAVIVVLDAVFRAMSRCLLASPDRDEAMACWTGTSMAPIAAGVSQHGFAFANTEMSHFAGGGGARVDADGVDTGGIVFNTTPNIANIETIEQDFPLLYLFRRHLVDSGGPGQYRGGASAELAYVVHDAPEGALEVVFSGTGAEMPNAFGLAGGLPGAAIRVLRVTGTDVPARLAAGQPLPATLDDVRGDGIEVMPQKHPRSAFPAGDVWYHHWQGGAGYGDPLDRDPEAVARDVRRRLASRECAARIYGVALDEGGAVDREATVRARERLRAARREGARPPETPVEATDPLPLGSGWSIAEWVEIVPGARLTRCRRCGQGLARDGQDHTRGCLRRDVPLTAAGPHRGEAYDRGRFRLVLFYCPGCLTQLDAEVVQDGAPRAGYALVVNGSTRREP